MTAKPLICLGAAVWDTILQVDEIPAAGIKVLAKRAVQSASGMAASAAVAIARLGSPVEFWSRLGDDDTGARYVRDIQAAGIDTRGLRAIAGMTTPFSSIIVDRHGERAVIPFYDAQCPSDPGWLPWQRVAGAGAVLVDVRWQEGAAALLNEAQRCKVSAILDADTAPAEVLNYLVPLASHVLFSEPALKIYSGFEYAPALLQDIAKRLNCEAVGVTLGPVGAAVYTRGSDAVLHEPAPAVQAVDTLNAGDIWHGTFAWALAEAKPMQEVVQMANVAAAMKCEVFGGNRGAPTLDALLARGKALGYRWN